MPSKEITLTYYKIKAMGLYAHTGQNGQIARQYLTAKDLMKELMEWGHGVNRQFIETATFSANSQSLESYCLDFHEDNGEYIIALWNKVPNSKNGYSSVSAKSSTLDATVQHTQIGKDDIPGYPTFFYISPIKKCIATIKLDNHVLGITQFKSYLKGYLRHFSSHSVNREEGGELIQGLCAESKPKGTIDNRFPDKGIYPSFHMTPFKDVLPEEYLMNNAHYITKIVKDVTTENLLFDKNESYVEKWSRFMNGIPISRKATTRLTIPVSFTYANVKKLIKQYQDNDGSSEYNVGFIFKGDQKIHWLAGTVVTNTVDGDLKMLSSERPELKSLMHLIKKLDHSKIIVKEVESVA
jgi:hypothetical protein